jgi:hypothetical protein
MNAQRRRDIAEIIEKIEAIDSIRCEVMELIEIARDEEQEYRDNMPEAFAYGEKGDRADEVVSFLEEAHTALENIDLCEITDALTNAAD